MKWTLGSLLSTRHEYRILALMLVALHLALWNNPEGALSRSLMLVHFGLFLLWQPMWNSEVRIRWNRGAIFLLAAIGFIAWLNALLMIAWLLALTAIVGGRVTLGRIDRLAHLGALFFLICEVLMGAVPAVFGIGRSSTFSVFATGLLVLPLILYFVPPEQEHAMESRIDFFYGLLISMLTAILALGGLFITFYSSVPYVTALLETILALAVFLLAVSWLWAPLAGFSGLGQLWERYLLNIGTPFEQWLGHVADAAESEDRPEEFLRSAVSHLVALPWVAGARWRIDGREHLLGTPSRHVFQVTFGDLICTVYARLQIGPSLLLHGKLLVQLIGHFYEAKRRAQELAQTAHLQAIYETGARVTHDIKNLLQSLHTLTVAVERGRDDPGALKLLSRQLPHISERLSLSLDKLQAPTTDRKVQISVSQWWASLCQRKDKERLVFEARIETDQPIPGELFDSVIENLLDNARIKRQLEPGISIKVHLDSTPEKLSLCVIDDGTPIDESVRAQLFTSPVPSTNGLGIGLLQAAKHAEQFGFRLTAESRPGEVKFSLTRLTSARPPHPLRRRSDLTGPYAHLVEDKVRQVR